MLVDAHELLWMSDLQRLDQDAVDDGKNRCVGTDTESQHQHRDYSEARTLSQLAEGEAEVIHGLLSVVTGRWSGETPNPKRQAPYKSQTPNTKQCISPAPRSSGLKIGASLGFGCW